MELRVVEGLIKALNKVLDNDRYLLIHRINEPAISHRLAVYLEFEFPDFNVDCEYNGNVDAGNGRKYIYLLKEEAKKLGILKGGEEEQEFLHRCVFPDIIVHRRGRNGSENNLLIIEVKKGSNQNDLRWDFEKLKRFTSSEFDNNFNFQYGVFVMFEVGDQPGYCLQWYQKGERQRRSEIYWKECQVEPHYNLSTPSE